jgi:DnaK suppressor protein
MVGKSKKSKAASLDPAKAIKPEEKIKVAKQMLLDMKEKLLAEGLGKCLPEHLARPFDIGDEGDRADIERTHEFSILISARDKEKLAAIEETLEKIREGTYGMCEDCGDKIGWERLKAMPLAKLCVTCQSHLEKETAHQKFAEEGMENQPLIDEAEGRKRIDEAKQQSRFRRFSSGANFLHKIMEPAYIEGGSDRTKLARACHPSRPPFFKE